TLVGELQALDRAAVRRRQRPAVVDRDRRRLALRRRIEQVHRERQALLLESQRLARRVGNLFNPQGAVEVEEERGDVGLGDELDARLRLEHVGGRVELRGDGEGDRKSTRLNSSHVAISYAVFCLKKKTNIGKMSKEAYNNRRIVD